MLKKSNVSKIFSLMTVILIMVSMMLPMTVFAAGDAIDKSTDKKVTFTDSSITMDNIGKALNGSTNPAYESGKVRINSGTGGSGKVIVNTKGEDYELILMETGVIYVNTSAFKNAKQSDVSLAMEKFTQGISDCGGNPDTVQQIMKDIQDTDSSVSSIMLPLIFNSTKGDMYAAYKIANPFLEVLSVVLGVGAVALILFLLFSTVMDLAYIGLPVWREAQANKEGGGGKNPFGVSYEAMTTVKEVEKGLGDGGYKNAYLLYFKRRALTYIILAICIMYLICGGLSGIIGFILSLVGGITG